MRTLFRVETGKLRYVHTLTHLLQGKFPGRWSERCMLERQRQVRPEAVRPLRQAELLQRVSGSSK